MKLTTMTQVTVDGVMQGNGAATDEDRRGGFERGGWAMGVFEDETRTFIDQTYQRADAFLFGRRTYELFAGYWGAMKNPDSPITDALNTKPKYVASTTLTDREKFEKLGFGQPTDPAQADQFATMFADKNIDIQTGALLGRYIAEERDSGRLFQACYAQLCAEEGDQPAAAASLARIEQLLEQLVARLPG